MKIGFIFPGQGTQTVGMGKDLYEQYEEAVDFPVCGEPGGRPF